MAISCALLEGQHCGVTHPRELCTYPPHSFPQNPPPAMCGPGAPSLSRMEPVPHPTPVLAAKFRPSLQAILGADGRGGVRVEPSPEGTGNTSTKVRGGMSRSPSRLPLWPPPGLPASGRRCSEGDSVHQPPQGQQQWGQCPLSGVRGSQALPSLAFPSRGLHHLTLSTAPTSD